MEDANEALIFGAIFQAEYEKKGGYRARRIDFVEAINSTCQALGLVCDELLDDAEGTAEWLTPETLRAIGGAVNLLDKVWQELTVCFIMEKGADTVLNAVREQLLGEINGTTASPE